jgi:putative acetyltransferase
MADVRAEQARAAAFRICIAMSSRLRFRLATEHDLPALARLYAQSVIKVGPQRYDHAQVAAWSAFASQADRFADFVLRPVTFIAEDCGVVGFAGIEPDGHVASLYVDGDRTRQGVGSALLRVLLDHAMHAGIASLHTEASQFSRPLFERFGFHVERTEVVEYSGVWFTRYVMRRCGRT